MTRALDLSPARTAQVVIDGRSLSLEEVAAAARRNASVRLTQTAIPHIEAGRAVVDGIVAAARPAYGITTGFASLSDQSIPPNQTRQLQVNLLRSHAAGVGDPLPTEVVRAATLLRANSLALGYSGVRPVLIEALLALLNAGIHPVVPALGSLGASGDLAPLAHLALPLLGLGSVEFEGKTLPAELALQRAGLTPIELEPKEALALINGTQIMAALGTLALLDAERLLQSAISVAALSLCGLAARRTPLDERVHRARPHPGQGVVAERLRTLLAPVPELEPVGGRIQDHYSIRCVPQVYGGIHDAMRPFRAMLEIEVNAATDNPLVFAEEAGVISGGNFHGHPLALGLDAVKLAVASLGTIIERRVALLVDGAARGLPPCLVREPGINSGYMIAHYLTASLVAQNRVLAHPSSVDSIPTSAGVEDYNSMGATAALHFRQVVANVENIVAVEALCAAQACDLAGRRPNGPLGDLYARIRASIPSLERDDRVVANDITAAVTLLREGGLIAATFGDEGGGGER